MPKEWRVVSRAGFDKVQQSRICQRPATVIRVVEKLLADKHELLRLEERDVGRWEPVTRVLKSGGSSVSVVTKEQLSRVRLNRR